jgi:hypothetical protein
MGFGRFLGQAPGLKGSVPAKPAEPPVARPATSGQTVPIPGLIYLPVANTPQSSPLGTTGGPTPAALDNPLSRVVRAQQGTASRTTVHGAMASDSGQIHLDLTAGG